MTETTQPVHCANHPGVETSLRCNRCEKPICVRCAVRTPTGYRCRECVRSQQKIFITAEWPDYILGFVTAAFLSFLTSMLVGLISTVAGIFGWFLIAAAAPTAGMVIAEAVRFVTRKHRARSLFITVAVGMVLGILPAVFLNMLALNVWVLVFQGIFLFVATPIVYARLSGITLK